MNVAEHTTITPGSDPQDDQKVNTQTSAVAIPVTNAENNVGMKPVVEKAETITARSLTSMTQQQNTCSHQPILVIGIIVVIVLVITLCVALIKPVYVEDDLPSPPSINFATGVSIITNYAVDTKVRSRLATTTINMEVLNGMNCSSVHIVTLQLPLNTRVASLKTIANDGCNTIGQVKEIEDARATFVEQTSQGLSSAYVEAQDGFTYTIQVSIPPYGSTKVELITEQLLQQRRGEIEFDIPLIPNEEVDTLLFDLTVEDIEGNPMGFQLGFSMPGVSSSVNVTNGTSLFHLDLHDARQHAIPRVVRGKYTPGVVPENGILHFDGTCFEHYFLPPSLKPMPRNLIFLLDVSDGHRHDTEKFEMSRTALMNFIDSLDDQDTFSIQTFAHLGTMDVWGPNKGTKDEKQDAVNYLQGLKPGKNDWYDDWGVNLHGAILEALIRARDDIKESKTDTVSVLIILSHEIASRGETRGSKIVNDVYGYNKDGSVKIFTLGYEQHADLELLDAISLMNGGISSTILERSQDLTTQITRFLQNELGSILLSDMAIEFPEGVNVVGETETYYPLLAEGYEVVIRGMVEGDLGPTSFKTLTKASTLEDVQNWVTVATDSSTKSSSALCYQSYAHARVAQLVRLRDASNFLNDKAIKSLVKLADPNCNEKEFVKCIEQEAIKLALDANIVAKGLTAMVTTDSDECMKIDDDAEVCLDGTTVDPHAWAEEAEMGDPMSSSMTASFCSMLGLIAMIVAILSNNV